MDWELVRTAAAICASACTGYAIFYAATAILWPRYFLRELWIERDYPDESIAKRIQMVALFVGAATSAWFASRGLTLGIPENWGSFDEDGDWSSYRDGIASTAAFVGGLGIFAISARDPDIEDAKATALKETRDCLVRMVQMTDLETSKKCEVLIREQAAKAAGRPEAVYSFDKKAAYLRDYWNGVIEAFDPPSWRR